MNNNEPTGFLLINKPKGWTSFDCIRRIRSLRGRMADRKWLKVGHAGTLDDFAQGLLIVCIGRQATRCVPLLMELSKTYIVTAKLGELTDSLDCTGKVLANQACESITLTDLQEASTALGHTYEQVPPVFSALKHKGVCLYNLARKYNQSREELEQVVQQKKRVVTIHQLRITTCNIPYFSFVATVSKGTYVRSLADDIAGKLDWHATVYELQRMQIGPFSLTEAVDIQECNSYKEILSNLIQIEKFLQKVGQ